MTSTTPTSARPPLHLPLYGANPAQALSRYVKKTFDFSGRASRSEYWWIAAFNVVVFIVFMVGFGVANSGGRMSALGQVFLSFLLLFLFLSIVPGIAVTVRRLHDVNLSGLVVLCALIPYLGLLIIIILAALASSPLGARFDKHPQPHDYLARPPQGDALLND